MISTGGLLSAGTTEETTKLMREMSAILFEIMTTRIGLELLRSRATLFEV